MRKEQQQICKSTAVCLLGAMTGISLAALTFALLGN
jgi:hypothetical protein